VLRQNCGIRVSTSNVLCTLIIVSFPRAVDASRAVGLRLVDLQRQVGEFSAQVAALATHLSSAAASSSSSSSSSSSATAVALAAAAPLVGELDVTLGALKRRLDAEMERAVAAKPPAPARIAQVRWRGGEG
jgi:hypothetical protein